MRCTWLHGLLPKSAWWVDVWGPAALLQWPLLTRIINIVLSQRIKKGGVGFTFWCLVQALLFRLYTFTPGDKTCPFTSHLNCTGVIQTVFLILFRYRTDLCGYFTLCKGTKLQHSTASESNLQSFGCTSSTLPLHRGVPSTVTKPPKQKKSLIRVYCQNIFKGFSISYCVFYRVDPSDMPPWLFDYRKALSRYLLWVGR